MPDITEAGAVAGARVTHVSEEMDAEGPYADADAFLHFEAGELGFEAGARVRVNSVRVRAARSVVSAEANSPNASPMVTAGRDRATRSIDTAEANSPNDSAMVSAGRGRATRSIDTAEANSPNDSAMVSAGQGRATRSIDTAEANSPNDSAMVEADTIEAGAVAKGVLKFGAGARVKASAGRVRVKRRIVSENASALVVANREAGAMVRAENACVSEEIDAEGQNAEAGAFIHYQSTPGMQKFGAGARVKASAGRVSVKRRIVSENASTLVVANREAGAMVEAEIVSVTEEIDAEGPNAEAGAFIHYQSTPGMQKFGAGARVKASAGRVSVKRRIVSENASALFVANNREAGAMVRAENACVSEEIDAEGPNAEAGAFIHYQEKPGKLECEVEASVKASLGKIKATQDDISAEANGPNASARVVVSNREVAVMAGAEVASASVSAGPAEIKVGLGVQTGLNIGPNGTEVKVLGCGFSLGSTTGVALFGNEVKFKLW
ncbi:uncharacterized protein LOC128617412 [Ictalurus furcatus]|uniref:uncharacterized protein LOC128617412 n=1 Tax=Ictalurus furcatus TaxID=66913 RepID=UPI00234FCC4A|nr:uncharacterized protein LOC128617412 [Ictalurus furcatus]